LNLQLTTLGSKLIIVFVLSIAFTSFLSVWISHRAVGPILKLISHLRHISTLPKDSPRPLLRFRRNDLFIELPDLVNGAVGAKSDEAK
jgi:hypothetical protein